MKNAKRETLENILRELAAQFLSGESSGDALITVTGCRFKENMRSAIILLSVLPEDRETAVLSFAKRKKKEFKEYIKSHSRLKYIPYVDFEIDLGEKNRQRIDELLNT